MGRRLSIPKIQLRPRTGDSTSKFHTLFLKVYAVVVAAAAAAAAVVVVAAATVVEFAKNPSQVKTILVLENSCSYIHDNCIHMGLDLCTVNPHNDVRIQALQPKQLFA